MRGTAAAAVAAAEAGRRDRRPRMPGQLLRPIAFTTPTIGQGQPVVGRVNLRQGVDMPVWAFGRGQMAAQTGAQSPGPQRGAHIDQPPRGQGDAAQPPHLQRQRLLQTKEQGVRSLRPGGREDTQSRSRSVVRSGSHAVVWLRSRLAFCASGFLAFYVHASGTMTPRLASTAFSASVTSFTGLEASISSSSPLAK